MSQKEFETFWWPSLPQMMLDLILDTAFGIPDETPVRNIHVMHDAARKYAG